MNDEAILDLYFSRSEEAIVQTDAAYGRPLLTLSSRILNSYEDAEESVNDTYLKAWNAIPPRRPAHFFGFLAKLCRCTSLDRLDWNLADKRGGSVVSLTQEMEQCIPDESRERQVKAKELGQLMNRFLGTLPEQTRSIFLRRYWYGDSVGEIAALYGIGESKVKTTLHRTRSKLKTFLALEEIMV